MNTHNTLPTRTQEKIMKDLSTTYGITKTQVKTSIHLLQTATIPFIARYRRDQTGGLDEEQLQQLHKQYQYQTNLEATRQKYIQKIQEHPQKSQTIIYQLQQAKTLQDLEEIMKPYKQKRKTKAMQAREQGLEPLATYLLGKTSLTTQIKTHLSNAQHIQGAQHIIAETIAHDPKTRETAMKHLLKTTITIELINTESNPYHTYNQYTQQLQSLKPHQIHAILRGEKEGHLKIIIPDITTQLTTHIMKQQHITPPKPYQQQTTQAIQTGIKKHLLPSITNETKKHLKTKADTHAIKVFQKNLEALLLTPPVNPQVIMGIDPGYKTGCKIAVINPQGDLLETTTIYPTPPHNNTQQATQTLNTLINTHKITLIVIGNGTAARETEQYITQHIKPIHPHITHAIISEIGASIYSASKIARQEFPNLQAAQRGAISIARRALDPLAEYIKIPPQHLGIGQYQHDINPKQLQQALTFTTQITINKIGINLNTATPTLLQHIAGLNHTLAQKIIKHRQEHGIPTREHLKTIKGIGPKTYEQAAGFLKIPTSPNPYDHTTIHPEQYTLATQILQYINHTPQDLTNTKQQTHIINKLKHTTPQQVKQHLNTTHGTQDITHVINQLITYNQDPRGIRHFQTFTTQAHTIEDLKENMILPGIVRNVTDFGAFIDLGIKTNGLIHISQLSPQYIQHPSDILTPGTQVTVKVINIDTQHKRIGLQLIEKEGQQIPW